MKAGSTRMAHKFEQAVDLETGAVCAVTVQSMDGGDTASLPVTLDEAERRLAAAEAQVGEVVADKGYHSNKTMTGVRGRGLRSYVSEPARGRRNWKRNRDAQKPTYANRRRIRGNRHCCPKAARSWSMASCTCWRREGSAVSTFEAGRRSENGS